MNVIKELESIIPYWPTHADTCREAIAEIERLRVALRTARGQLITLGGDACGPDCDQIQCAVLKEIDTALHGRHGD